MSKKRSKNAAETVGTIRETVKRARGMKRGITTLSKLGAHGGGKAGKAEPKVQMGKGLDVGTAFVYCAQMHGDSVVFRSQRDAFFDVEVSDFAKEIFKKLHVRYIQKGDRLCVVGDEAIRFANIFNRNTRRPMSRGVVSPEEEDALPMIELIIKNVLGLPRRDGEVAYYSVPGDPIDADFDVVYHTNLVRSMIGRWGYTPKPLNEALAVILSELAAENFTGIGLSFGGGMVNVALAHLSVPIFSFSVAKAGDWIDEQAAKVTGSTASKVCAIKEKSLDLTKTDGLSRIEHALATYYEHLIEYVLAHIKQEIERTRKMPVFDTPLTMVVSGGTASVPGFITHFKRVLKKIHFPLQVGEARLASEPLYSVAKGALVMALSDERRK